MLNSLEFDSYMLFEEDLKPGVDLRLLSVDFALILPVNRHIKLLITSYDVIHSFAVPKLGIKTDAVPGRINQTFIKINGTGTMYGQCSELCGILHAFMPIEVKSVS